MARKDLLKKMMQQPAVQVETGAAPLPRRSTGAIGAVSQSIADLKTRSIQDIHPSLIDNGGFQDRLDSDPDDHAALVASIREYGQQVPVLLRVHPQNANRFQIVFGRRRVAALRELNIPVKAMVRDLSNHDLAMAQGQENSARKDLSYIEKCNFARQLRDAGFERKAIIDALHVDKTQVSRMLQVADGLSLDVITAIGAAPKAGRDRWHEMVALCAGKSTAEILALLPDTGKSDTRFQALYDALTHSKENKKERKKRPAPQVIQSKDGEILGTAKRTKTALILSLDATDDTGFARWLEANLSDLHRRFKDGK